MSNRVPMPRPAAQMTEEEKRQKVAQFIQQKREQYALNILCSLCKGGVATEASLVPAAVKMADQLFEALYPMPKEGE